MLLSGPVVLSSTRRDDQGLHEGVLSLSRSGLGVRNTRWSATGHLHGQFEKQAEFTTANDLDYPLLADVTATSPGSTA